MLSVSISSPFFLLFQVTEVENDMSPVQEDEGPNAVSQLAKKVCKNWQPLLEFWDRFPYKNSVWKANTDYNVVIQLLTVRLLWPKLYLSASVHPCFDLWPPVCGWLCVQMQGAGAKSWNRLSALFNKDDEHQLLEETESPPVADQWVENFLFCWHLFSCSSWSSCSWSSHSHTLLPSVRFV